MVKKPRENRVPIMMSDDELAQIDDWRFSNRVATRSDAIRRLCQMALVLDKEMSTLEEAIESIPEYLDEYGNLVADYLDNEKLGRDGKHIFLRYSIALSREMNKHFKVLKDIVRFGGNFKRAEELSELLERARIMSIRIENQGSLFDDQQKGSAEADDK